MWTKLVHKVVEFYTANLFRFALFYGMVDDVMNLGRPTPSPRNLEIISVVILVPYLVIWSILSEIWQFWKFSRKMAKYKINFDRKFLKCDFEKKMPLPLKKCLEFFL